MDFRDLPPADEVGNNKNPTQILRKMVFCRQVFCKRIYVLTERCEDNSGKKILHGKVRKNKQ